MVFKKRLFHGDVPDEDKVEAVPPSSNAELERRAAETISSVADLDGTQISVVVSDGKLVLSGFVASGLEGQKAEAVLREAFLPIAVENRLRIG